MEQTEPPSALSSTVLMDIVLHSLKSSGSLPGPTTIVIGPKHHDSWVLWLSNLQRTSLSNFLSSLETLLPPKGVLCNHTHSLLPVALLNSSHHTSSSPSPGPLTPLISPQFLPLPCASQPPWPIAESLFCFILSLYRTNLVSTPIFRNLCPVLKGVPLYYPKTPNQVLHILGDFPP